MSLVIYKRGPDGLVATKDPAALGHAIWVDLLDPTEEEEKLVEAAFNIDAPTEIERAALEQSARFYEENGALVMTATLVMRHAERAKAAGVSFILVNNALVTVRTIEPTAFKVGQGRATARIDKAEHGADVLLALLEAVIERLADVLQETSTRAQTLSDTIFNTHGFSAPDMSPALTELSHLGSIVTLGRDSLGSLERRDHRFGQAVAGGGP